MGVPKRVVFGDADEEEQKNIDAVERFLRTQSKEYVIGYALNLHLSALRMEAFIELTNETMQKIFSRPQRCSIVEEPSSILVSKRRKP